MKINKGNDIVVLTDKEGKFLFVHSCVPYGTGLKVSRAIEKDRDQRGENFKVVVQSGLSVSL